MANCVILQSSEVADHVGHSGQLSASGKKTLIFQAESWSLTADLYFCESDYYLVEVLPKGK